jgi:4-hydroxybenzoate polyprenyltransferase
MTAEKSQTFKTIFSLIRFPNLIIIGMSMVLIQFTLIKPILEMNGLQATINLLVFTLLVISTMLLAAGGYVVNDILDVKIDLINKPDKVLVGKKYPLQACWDLYWSLTIAGIIAGLLAAWYNKTNTLMSIAPLEAGLLWFYSSILKRKFLVGNIIVSFLCALALFKPMLFNAATFKIEGLGFLVLGYCGFAFLLTLIREIIKDIEDLNGDEAYDCKTMPIVIGATAAKALIIVLTLFLMIALGWFQYNQTLSDTFRQTDYLSFSYILLLIQLPLVGMVALLLKAKTPLQYHQSALIAKGIMVSGLCSMLVFYFLM